jgi:hypothetical protein
MADKPAEIDWSEVSGRTIERLRTPRVAAVPATIVALAQKSWDKQSAFVHKFADAERAAAFAKLMKQAGSHTDPLTSVSVAIDPQMEDEGRSEPDKTIVGWQAGKRRGRLAGQ